MTNSPKYLCIMFNSPPHYNMDQEISQLLRYLEKETGLLLSSALRTVKIDNIPQKENFATVIEDLKFFAMADLTIEKKINNSAEDNIKENLLPLDFGLWQIGVRWVEIKFPQPLIVQVAWLTPP